MSTRPVRAVLLDALGTLVALEEPWGHLRSELAARGVEVAQEDARRAMRAEMAHYGAQHHRAGTAAGLATLRRECAGVIEAELATGLPPAEVEAALLGAVRFVAYPDAAPVLRELRGMGLRLVVVSNWDVSLHEVLARTGLAPLLDGAVASAEVGAAKPDGRIFARALELAGADADEALHVGDAPVADVLGARAAGLAAVLVARDHAGGGLGSAAAGDPTPLPAGVPTLGSLAGIPELVRYRRTQPA